MLLGITDYPRYKTEDVKDAEDQEYDAAGPVSAREHVDGCSEAEDDV
jgi:hypothetical protein